MLAETRDALIAQQQMMQTSLNEAIREVSERVWDEAFEATCEAHDAYGGLNYTPPNPYKEKK